MLLSRQLSPVRVFPCSYLCMKLSVLLLFVFPVSFTSPRLVFVTRQVDRDTRPLPSISKNSKENAVAKPERQFLPFWVCKKNLPFSLF